MTENRLSKIVTHFPYTDEQLNIIEALVDFTYSNRKIILLKGAAGTGKSTVLKAVLENRRRHGAVVVTAPTHKAKRVIEHITGVKAKTVHQLLKLRPNFNLDTFDINNIPFDTSSSGEEYIKNYSLVIIDEAYTINTGLKKLLEERASIFNVQIIYIGDPYQLPPVRESSSPVGNTKDQLELFEIVRQDKDSPLVHLLELAREDVRRNSAFAIKFMLNNHTDIDSENRGFAIFDSRNKDNITNFNETVANFFKAKEFLSNINYVKYAAFTNDTILSANHMIREGLLKHPENILTKDDLLTAYNTILDEFGNPIITNSEDYIIYSDGAGPVLYEYEAKEFNIKGYLVRLQNVADRSASPKNLFIVDHSIPMNYVRFLKTWNTCKQRAIKTRNWRRDYYEKFKDKHLLIKTFYDDQGEVLVGKDLDYGYALTIHKCQGSTYENIFVNANDIIYSKFGNFRADTNLRNRLIYTALSRARKKAFILL
jgi:hypothetical protein